MSIGNLKSLTLLGGGRTRRFSSHDRSGGNHDFREIAAGDTLVAARIPGAGCINHIWCTLNAPEDRYYLRNIVLRMYWDGEEHPSVECPLGDFFNMGHGIAVSCCSVPVATVAPAEDEGKLGGHAAMSCYWQMPFQKGALITFENQASRPVPSLYYYIDYEELPGVPDSSVRFHAQWRRENPAKGVRGDLAGQGINYWDLMQTPNRDGAENYVILEAQGAGHFTGCNLSVDNIDPTPDGLTWWGEGDDMIFIDGESEPSLIGTGTEDYFGHAWGMHRQGYLWTGASLLAEGSSKSGRHKSTCYRFHVEDPVRFSSSIRVTIEHGHANLQSNDYSSTAFWYQTEPHLLFPPLPGAPARRPRPE